MSNQPSPLTRKLLSFIDLSEDEINFVESIQHSNFDCSTGKNFLQQGHAYTTAFTIIRGWLARSIVLEDGKRQIVDFALPGDIVCLQGFFVDEAHEDIHTLGDVSLSKIDYSDFTRLLERFPDIGALVFWLDTELVSHAQKVASLGRQDARHRIAFFLAEHEYRQRRISTEPRAETIFPVTQQDIADYTGMTSVHVSRTMKQLTDDGYISARWANSVRFEKLDSNRLEDLTGFSFSSRKFRRRAA